MGAAAAVEIGPARALDALPTLALHRRVLEEQRWFISRPDELTVTVDERERHIRSAAAADSAVFLVARVPESRCAGLLTVVSGPLARVRHVGRLEVMVSPELRGRGIGRALMVAAVAWAERSPLQKLALAVFADNERAVHLYRSLGFVQEGRRVAEYLLEDGSTRDDVLMARVVS